MNRKKNIAVICGVLLCITASMPAYAATGLNEGSSAVSITQITPRGEQTIWYYRVINGVNQKRLWSVTYGCWKTDWINV